MKRRSSRLGRRSIPRASRRNLILPAPGFMPVENGMQLNLDGSGMYVDFVPQQLLNRPGRPSSELFRLPAAAKYGSWMEAAFGPSVN